MQCIPEEDHTWCYYLLPCFFLFDRSNKLLKLVLNVIGSCLIDSSLLLPYHTSTKYASNGLSQINAIVSLLLFLYKDNKVQKIISLFRTEIGSILQSIASLQVWFCSMHYSSKKTYLYKKIQKCVWLCFLSDLNIYAFL